MIIIYRIAVRFFARLNFFGFFGANSCGNYIRDGHRRCRYKEYPDVIIKDYYGRIKFFSEYTA